MSGLCCNENTSMEDMREHEHTSIVYPQFWQRVDDIGICHNKTSIWSLDLMLQTQNHATMEILCS